MTLRRISKELQEAKDHGFEVLLDEDDPYSWTVCVRTGRVRVTFPHDYPFKPPQFEPLPKTRNAKAVPLYKFLFFERELVRQLWSPALRVPKLLMYEPCPGYADYKLDDVDVSSITADTAAVYIGVGVGGCDNGARFPSEMQAAVDTRGHCFFLLIDPNLRLERGLPRRTYRTDPGTNITVVLEEAPLYASFFFV